MLRRLKNRLKFGVERLIMRGAHYRLLAIAALIGLVSIVAGALVLVVSEGFDDPAEAGGGRYSPAMRIVPLTVEKVISPSPAATVPARERALLVTSVTSISMSGGTEIS